MPLRRASSRVRLDDRPRHAAFVGTTGAFNSIHRSPDGRWLVMARWHAGVPDRSVDHYKLDSGRLNELPHASIYLQDGKVAFLTGRVVYPLNVKAGVGLRVWELAGEREVATIRGAAAPVTAGGGGRLAFVVRAAEKSVIRVVDEQERAARGVAHRIVARLRPPFKRDRQPIGGRSSGRWAAEPGSHGPSTTGYSFFTVRELFRRHDIASMHLLPDGKSVYAILRQGERFAEGTGVFWDIDSGCQMWEISAEFGGCSAGRPIPWADTNRSSIIVTILGRFGGSGWKGRQASGGRRGICPRCRGPVTSTCGPGRPWRPSRRRVKPRRGPRRRMPRP